MKYKGYDIKAAVLKRAGWKDHHCIGIFDGGEVMSFAVDREIAQRAVDAHTKSGLWPDLERAAAADGREVVGIG